MFVTLVLLRSLLSLSCLVVVCACMLFYVAPSPGQTVCFQYVLHQLYMFKKDNKAHLAKAGSQPGPGPGAEDADHHGYHSASA